MSADRCAIAIIGAGMAGLEIARWIAPARAEDVVVIEAGPLAGLTHVNTTVGESEALSLWLREGVDPYFWRGWNSARPPHYERQSGLRRRVGGRSLYWYGVCLPIEDWALADPCWPRAVVRDLIATWKGGAPLYARTEAMLDRAGYVWHNGAAPSSTFAGHHLVPAPRRIRHLAPGRWSAYSPLDSWCDPDDGRLVPGRLTFRLRAATEAVALDVVAGRVRGVWLRATGSGAPPQLLQAEAVVLAGGALENARLALATGALGSDSRPVTDHIVTGLLARLNPETAVALVSDLGWGEYYAPCPEVRANLFVTLTPCADGSALFDAQLTGEQLPGPHSSVSLNGDGRLVVSAWPDRPEQAVIAGQQAILNDLWSAVCESGGLPHLPLDFADYNRPRRGNACLLDPPPASTVVTWSNTLGTEDHEACTLAFGDALDANGELRALPGAFVAGAAAFPRTGAANPALSILALARRLGTALGAGLAKSDTAAVTWERSP